MSVLRSKFVFRATEIWAEQSGIVSALEVEQVAGPDGSHERSLTLLEARQALLNESVEIAVKDSIWRFVIRMARECNDDWVLAAVWLMIPSLRRIGWRWSGGGRIERGDVEAEIIVSFVEALISVDPAQEDLEESLQQEIRSHIGRVFGKALRDIPVDDFDLFLAVRKGACEPADLLRDAVHGGVLDVAEDPVGRIQLEGERLGSLAHRMGIRYSRCVRSRRRAGDRYHGYLRIPETEGQPDDDRSVAPPPGKVPPPRAGARRSPTGRAA